MFSVAIRIHIGAWQQRQFIYSDPLEFCSSCCWCWRLWEGHTMTMCLYCRQLYELSLTMSWFQGCNFHWGRGWTCPPDILKLHFCHWNMTHDEATVCFRTMRTTPSVRVGCSVYQTGFFFFFYDKKWNNARCEPDIQTDYRLLKPTTYHCAI